MPSSKPTTHLNFAYLSGEAQPLALGPGDRRFAVVMPTLLTQATQHADEEHARRTAELKALAPLLAHFKPLRLALQAQGLQVYSGNVRLSHHYPTGHFGKKLKVLQLRTRGFWTCDEGAVSAKWLAALAGMGFVEMSRSGTIYRKALLRRGPLLLEVDAPPAPPAPADAPVQEQPAAPAAPQTAQAAA